MKLFDSSRPYKVSLFKIIFVQKTLKIWNARLFVSFSIKWIHFEPKNFNKNIDRLAFEGVSIHNSDADVKMNSR